MHLVSWAGRHDEMLLSDFGIAVVAHSSRSQSTQEVIGTASYMAPEQIQGFLPATTTMLPDPTGRLPSATPRPASFYASLTLAESKLQPLQRRKRGISRRMLLFGAIGMVGLAGTCGGLALWTLSHKPLLGSTLVTYTGHLSPVATVAWSPDGQLIASASNDGTVRVWQAS